MSLLLNNPAHWHCGRRKPGYWRCILGIQKLTLLSSRSRMNTTILQSVQRGSASQINAAGR